MTTPTKSEIMAILKRRESGTILIESLLKEYGGIRRHPRTSDLVIGQTSGIRNLAQTPRITHNRHINQQIKSGAYYIGTEKQIYEKDENPVKFRKTSQWETVWYQKGMRRK